MKKMFSLEELLNNCFFPLFRSNLTAKFDKKQARFEEINRNLDSPEYLPWCSAYHHCTTSFN